VGFQENYPGVLNGDNLADVLKAARSKEAREKREVISLASPPQIV